MDILSFVQQVTERITALAWALFLLTWSIGWTLRGAPLPISRLKRIGSGLIEDSIWAAFWLAIGSSLFSFIVYIVKMITGG
ncbi:MAG: hypothetical protein F7B61_01210 [Caldisphaeraceae archaeon]|nr:hypothetical protein [Caldisphaeraceae archaeon]